ncbi:hypothetical protein Hden_0983 [Hyphomicrobium denitrificans ATCC 51888]|uniref:Rap1a immunity protein domain-containing protein n=1 Tax=Hyphomicrobium denitrificans (strain ATCC 51888 / DSM 1869 / NCIMB 11706 / TK 0415) TaxID=582899 RepID=D8JUY1_HYPDA|nr:hypothetical protein Hden_0983 [Hyphomicrobium denitrificans ATCC 51888]
MDLTFQTLDPNDSGLGRTYPKDSSLAKIFSIVALCVLMLQATPVSAEPDVHTAKFWLPHCQKSDMACIGYLQALLDINNLERENGYHVQWCAPEIIKLEDLRVVIVRKLKAEPDSLSSPFVRVATNALISAYPCLEDLIK